MRSPREGEEIEVIQGLTPETLQFRDWWDEDESAKETAEQPVRKEENQT